MRDSRLIAYADTLQAAGFAIYEPGGHWEYFIYSRVIDGRECFGIVQADYFGEISHSMPIRPSRENGSAIILPGWDRLTVERAQEVARPRNVGVARPGVPLENYYDPRRLERMLKR